MNGVVRRGLGVLLPAVVVVAGAAACTGNGRPAGGPAVNGHRVDILVSATATEPRPMLDAKAMAVLSAAAADPDAADGKDGSGSYARVLAAAGAQAGTFPLTPRRRDGAVEHGLNRGHLIEQNVGRVAAAVAGVRAERPGLDLLEALDDATRGMSPATLIVVSHGLSTGGGLDLRQVGWKAAPREVADQLSRRGLLPALRGWQVIFTGLGATAGDQPPLSRPIRMTLAAYWRAICARAGGDCVVDDAPLAPTAPAATAAMPTVAVPGVTSVAGPSGRVTYTVSDTLLGFAGNSAELSPAAIDYLTGLAGRVTAAPGTTVTVTGFCADPPGSTRAGMAELSGERARSVAAVLRRLGHAGNPITIVAGGVAPGRSATRHGHFDETRAAQMRRVEITFQRT